MVQILCYAVNISDNHEPYKSPQKRNVKGVQSQHIRVNFFNLTCITFRFQLAYSEATEDGDLFIIQF